MSLTILSGSLEHCQIVLIALCGPILNNPLVPFTDETGAVLQVPMTADLPDMAVGTTLTSPLVHVGIEPGPISLLNNYGLVGLSQDGTMWDHLGYSLGCKARFVIYAPKDAQRRFLANWLMWGIHTAWSTDALGVRIDNFIIDRLRMHGMSPVLHNLFDKVDLPDPNLRDTRPLGQAYKATVRMTFDLTFTWQTPTVQTAASIAVQPVQNLTTQTPLQSPGVQPTITIPMPFTLTPPYGG